MKSYGPTSPVPDGGQWRDYLLSAPPTHRMLERDWPVLYRACQIDSPNRRVCLRPTWDGGHHYNSYLIIDPGNPYYNKSTPFESEATTWLLSDSTEPAFPAGFDHDGTETIVSSHQFVVSRSTLTFWAGYIWGTLVTLGLMFL